MSVEAQPAGELKNALAELAVCVWASYSGKASDLTRLSCHARSCTFI